jgi:hypothetical protein
MKIYRERYTHTRAREREETLERGEIEIRAYVFLECGIDGGEEQIFLSDKIGFRIKISTLHFVNRRPEEATGAK